MEVQLGEHTRSQMFNASHVCSCRRLAAGWAQRSGGFGRGEPIGSPEFLALDADHDGIVSAAEIANAPAAPKALSRNGDRKVTEAEVRPKLGRRVGRGE